MTIGGRPVDPPVVLAPMAGVTNIAYRRLCRDLGAGLTISEMITARGIVENNAKTLAMVTFAPDEPRSVQLYGVDPAVIAGAVARLVDGLGVEHVDLNFGCPAPKVTRKGGGAALPVHRVLFRSVVRAAVRAADGVPVTVKLRIGLDDRRPTGLEAALVAQDEGVAAVTLHARTAEQCYSGHADWSAIATMKAALDIPVLGNGDVWEAADAVMMLDETGCDGVVIGRGCLGRPWLFRELAAAVAGRPVPPPPSLGEVVATMRLHARLLCDAAGDEAGARDFRKHVAWYLTGFPVGGDRRRRLAEVSSAAELDRLLDELLADLDPAMAFPPQALRATRGHSHGPRPVALPPGWLDTVDDPTPPVGADALVSGG